MMGAQNLYREHPIDRIAAAERFDGLTRRLDAAGKGIVGFGCVAGWQYFRHRLGE